MFEVLENTATNRPWRDQSASAPFNLAMRPKAQDQPPFHFKYSLFRGVILPLFFELPLSSILVSFVYSTAMAARKSPENAWNEKLGIAILIVTLLFGLLLLLDGLLRLNNKFRGRPIFSVSVDGVQSRRIWANRKWAWADILRLEITNSKYLPFDPDIRFVRNEFWSESIKVPGMTKKQKSQFRSAVESYAHSLLIVEERLMNGTSPLFGQKGTQPGDPAKKLHNFFEMPTLKIEPIEIHMKRGDAAIAAIGATSFGGLLLWYAIMFLAWPDYQPTEHWLEYGRKTAIFQDFVLKAISYPPIVRTVPVLLSGALLTIDGIWRLLMIVNKRPIVKLDAFGLAAYRFWQPKKLAWAEIDEVGIESLPSGDTAITIFGKHEFGKPTSEFPFFQIARPKISLDHLTAQQIRVVYATLALNAPDARRSIQAGHKSYDTSRNR